MPDKSKNKINNRKVAVIDTMPDLLITGLQKIGYEVEYLPQINSGEFIKIANNFFGIVIRSKFPLNKEVIDSAVNLKFIGRAGSGMETIDQNYAKSKGIICVNAPEGNRDAVGEHTMGLLLGLLNKINIGDREVRKGRWIREKNRGFELNGKIVGILGYGNMGSAFAKRLQGFDVHTIAYDKNKTGYSNGFIKEVNLNTLFEQTEILSIHVPLDKDTEYMVNDNYINKFKKNIFIINTARGKILNTKDLVKNLKTGKVLGTALDVLEFEDQTFEKLVINGHANTQWLKYLLEAENVILSPHVAGITFQSWDKIGKVLLEKIASLKWIS